MKLISIYNELLRTDWSNLKSPRSVKSLSEDVLEYFGDNRDIRTIGYKEVVEFTNALKKQKLTGSTINRKLAVLSKFFTVARRHDPKINRPEITRQKEGRPRQRVLTSAEAELLTTTNEWKYPEYRDLTIVLVDTGVRPSEITDGDWSLHEDELTLRDTKNGEDRTIILTPDAKAALLRLKQGRKFKYNTYYIEFKRVAKALGMDNEVVVYTLRHSALTRLANATDNVFLIQKWAGHKDLQTTQRYVKAARKGMENLANVLRRH